jgi:hypothetical protein
MTAPYPASSNVASDAATVGVQAQTVHGDVTVYQLSDDTPEEKYRVGVNYLDGGMPARACELIYDAIVKGHETSEVRFHWLIALLSGRTIRQLTKEDFSKLKTGQERPLPSAGDAWADGVKLIFRLLDLLKMPGADLQLVVGEFGKLGPVQRDMIFRHLEMLLKGPLEDQVWHRELERVKENQMGDDRQNRVWIFFEPKPAGPRVRQPVRVEPTTAERFRATAAAAVFGLAAAYIGWQALRSSAWTLIAYLVSAVGGYTGVINGLEWHFRVEWIHTRDQQHLTPRLRTKEAPAGGFAATVDRLFSHYSAKYAPEGVDRTAWLDSTAGIRRYLRDEIAEVYREAGVKADRVAWLIRHRVTEVKWGWRAGTLTDYRDRFRPRPATKAACWAGLAAFALGGFWVISAAVRTEPLSAAVSVAVTALAGGLAARSWLRILLERRRFSAAEGDSKQRQADTKAAFDRWCAKLARKPADKEMAAWLDCDRKILMDQAIRHYQLAPSNVITHAFIEAPAATHKSARVRNGPPRYSRYHLLLFLLTTDGVRQMTADLDFENGSFHDRHRTNFRFDAVAAVHVSETDDHQRTFKLELVNGHSISAQVTEASTEQLAPGEDPESLSRTALDATGLTTTLHVLEGIAAEGKEWIKHESQQENGRMAVPTPL